MQIQKNSLSGKKVNIECLFITFMLTWSLKNMHNRSFQISLTFDVLET